MNRFDPYNPIRTVDGVAIPCPSSYQWGLSDVSAPKAGRTEAVTMDKMRIGQVRKLELSWQNISIGDASIVLKAFNPEYIFVEYLDAMEGKFVTSEFYVGDRTTPLYNCRLGVWSNVSFNIVERGERS